MDKSTTRLTRCARGEGLRAAVWWEQLGGGDVVGEVMDMDKSTTRLSRCARGEDLLRCYDHPTVRFVPSSLGVCAVVTAPARAGAHATMFSAHTVVLAASFPAVTYGWGCPNVPVVFSFSTLTGLVELVTLFMVGALITVACDTKFAVLKARAVHLQTFGVRVATTARSGEWAMDLHV